MISPSVLASLLFSISLTLPTFAVIVAGANGGGNNANNTTQAQLESAVGAPFPMYDNVIGYAGATGLYLGYNPATSDVWVLTARHIFSDATNGSTVTIQGQTYNRQPEGPGGFGSFPGGDYRLVRYRRMDLTVPNLPAIQISATAPISGTALVMIGNGQNRVEAAALSVTTSDATSTGVGTGYAWTGPNRKRWGTNVIEGEFANSLEVPVAGSGVTGTINIAGVNSISYMTDFDGPTSPNWLSSNEAQGSVGDSGGSAFYQDGPNWVLSGMFSAVSGFSGQNPSTSAFGNVTIVADAASYKSAIDSAIAVTLVPEPSAACLLAIASAGLFSRRRRSMCV